MAGNEAIQAEILFNSVEMELTRRWAFGEVPIVFVSRPVKHLQATVKAWWQIYHKCAAAADNRNRTVWVRNHAYPAQSLDTPALIDHLRSIGQLIDLAALRPFRRAAPAELSAVCLLGMISAYYVELEN